MIDTDTRQIKRDDKGFYRSGGTRKVTSERKMICDHCGLIESCLAGAPELQPASCDEFLPALPFLDETGMGGAFNTVRIGVAWTQRLVIGQRIALYNPKQKRIFGHATVTELHAGPIEEILRDHAHNNHLMLDEPRHLAALTLFNWQRQNYGPRIVGEHTKLTAIYLRREDGDR